MEVRAVPTTFTVNSLADNNVGIGNTGDLRYVINRANALNTGTSTAQDIIQFTGVNLTEAAHTIRVGSGAAGAPATARPDGRGRHRRDHGGRLR